MDGASEVEDWRETRLTNENSGNKSAKSSKFRCDPPLSELADDSDHDGLSNGDEFRAGTNPEDFDSVFVIKSVTSDPISGAVSVEFNSVPGKAYSTLVFDRHGFVDGGECAAAFLDCVWHLHLGR